MTVPVTRPADAAQHRAAEVEKSAAGQASAALVEDGMTVGLGTGSTVAFLLPELARRGLSIRCVATSQGTYAAAHVLGLHVEAFSALDHLDIAIDGADQIAPDGWLIKGGGAAHTREKIVAAAADRFVVIADSTKLVPALHGPVPLELLTYGLNSTLRRLPTATVRDVPVSPDGGVIADYHAEIIDPHRTAAYLSGVPGVIDHGLFPPSLTTDILVAAGPVIDHRRLS